MAESLQSKQAAASPSSSRPQSRPSSNLDSFFKKRQGQGQSSRLWAGPGRSGAVPGFLRTRFHAFDDETAEGVGPEHLPGTRRSRAETATPAGSVSSSTPGGTIRRERSESEDNRSLSPLGTSGGWGELEGNSRRSVKASDEKPGRTLLTRSASLRAYSASQLSGADNNGTGAASLPTQPGSGRGRAGTGRSSTKAAEPTGSIPAATPAGGLSDENGGTSHEIACNPRPPVAVPSVRATYPPAPRPSALSPGPVRAMATASNASATPAASTDTARSAREQLDSRPSYREKRLEEVLSEEVVKLDQLRQISWNGIPPRHRATVWQLLVGYMPANRGRRAAAMERKRREYREAVPHYFDVPDAARTHQEQNILRQILVDVPRTCPDVPFFHQEKVQRAMERILYIWAIRHPASGYVQGINDLMTPLYVVFLSTHVGSSVESTDVTKVDEALLYEVEADVYWCLTKLLDNIQDHYTAMQPGLQRMVLRLEELVQRIDADLHRHISDQGLLYIQFAFRWMNCLLMRELPLRAVVRAWDTYLAEENGFESFHIYVSAALLCHFSSTLREMDFQSMVMYLQDLPTREWGEEEVEPLLSQAYILSTLFEGSPNHLSAA